MDKEINICIPTLTRYDLLQNLIDSGERSNLLPTKYYIIDNGCKLLPGDLNVPRKNLELIKPRYNMGVAASWNFFLQNVPEDIIICNDDLEFYEDTLEVLVAHYDPNFIIYPGGNPSSNSFSCFLIPRHIIDEIGMFDETLSPRYAYFEDNDYHYRMLLKGYTIKPIENCRIKHTPSSTVKLMSEIEQLVHHEKFRLAQENYLKKWGGPPAKEKFKLPYGNSRKDNG